MGIKDMMAGIRERKQEKKEEFRRMNDQVRMEEIINERKMSANERELNQYMKEDREAEIKIRLNQVRKVRDNDMKFGHNPLNAPNTIKNPDWEVLKEKNIFTNQKNMFMNQKNLFMKHKKVNHGRLMK